jgi:hypothetical protein
MVPVSVFTIDLRVIHIDNEYIRDSIECKAEGIGMIRAWTRAVSMRGSEALMLRGSPSLSGSSRVDRARCRDDGAAEL